MAANLSTIRLVLGLTGAYVLGSALFTIYSFELYRYDTTFFLNMPVLTAQILFSICFSIMAIYFAVKMFRHADLQETGRLGTFLIVSYAMAILISLTEFLLQGGVSIPFLVAGAVIPAYIHYSVSRRKRQTLPLRAASPL